MNRKMEWGEEPEFFGPRHYFRESLILQCLGRYVPRRTNILDAGSGNGSMSFRMGREGYRKITGVDYSNGFVEYASNKAKKEKSGAQIQFRKADISKLDFENACFDAVVSGEVLEHLEDDLQAVKEFQRVLRNGGLCIITVPAHPHLWDKNDEWAGHFRRYTRARLKRLFEKSGFEIIECTYWGFPLTLLFHKFVYLPVVKRKIIRGKKNISREKGMLYRIMKNEYLHRSGSKLFFIDNLFNFLRLGPGLLLVAKKI